MTVVFIVDHLTRSKQVARLNMYYDTVLADTFMDVSLLSVSSSLDCLVLDVICLHSFI
jgi:hypothetical protein